MYNSALVIGAGGTGRWVLTHLRARILGMSGWLSGESPAPLGGVRLVGFDIDSQNAYEFAGHGLTESDLVFSTPEIADVIRNIRDVPDGDHRALYQEVREWISQREAESYDLALLNEFMETGAGQMRQWGRLGVVLAKGFYDHLRTAVGSLAAGGQVNVYVTGSLCGGTGSATIFDAAAIVHDVLKSVAPNTPRRIIGVFLLPAGMTHDVNPAEFPWLEACAFASMRELDRFQRSNGRNRLKHDGRKIVLGSRLFDLCYLLDGIRDHHGGALPPNNLINNKASLGVYPAMADLIFSYLNPASGQRLDADAANAVAHVGGSHPYKYSKFGTHTLWSPLPLVQRSLAIDDALAVLNALTSQTAVGDVPSLVSTPAVTFEDKNIFNAQVFLAARRYDEDGKAQAPRAAEVLPWLLPADPEFKPKIPSKPDYASREFPNIRNFHTPYRNPEVKSRVDELLNKYLADIQILTDSHRRQLLADFRTYLLVRCQRIANTPTVQGGLARALNSLKEIKGVADRLRESFTKLNEIEARSGRLDGLRGAYRNAQMAMDDNKRWNDAMKQRHLFEAANRLMEAEIDAQVRAKLIDLMERLSATIDDVRDKELDGWRRTFEDLAGQASQASADLDRMWNEHTSVVVRQVILTRHSGLEVVARQRLTDGLLNRLPADRNTVIASPATAFVEQKLSWTVGRSAATDQFTLMLRHPWMEGDRHELKLLKLRDLLLPLESSYAFVLDTPFGEALRHSSKDIAGLASDIRKKTSLLASTSPEPGTKPAPLPTKQVLLFGPWGDGTPEIRQLRDELARLGFAGGEFEDVLQLTAADSVAARDVPLNQSVWVVHSYHGVSFDGFGTMDKLRQGYLTLREGEKPLHVFPEERAASLIEKRISELFHAGLVSSRIDLLGPEAVGLARESRLIRQVVLLIAAKQLEWRFNRVDDCGEWVLYTEGSQSLVLAASDKALNLLPTLVDHAAQTSDSISKRILDAIDKTARGVSDFDDDSEIAKRLTAIAEGSIDEPGISDLDEDMKMMIRISSWTLLGS